MGNLRITEKGLKLEGDSEFLQPLYAKEIQSKPVSHSFSFETDTSELNMRLAKRFVLEIICVRWGDKNIICYFNASVNHLVRKTKHFLSHIDESPFQNVLV